MKILHVIQRYPPAVGGSEQWGSEVARHQARHGHLVRVVTLDIVAEEEFWREASPSEEHYRLGRLDLLDGVAVRRFRRSLPVWTVHHLLFRYLLDRILDINLLGPHSRDMLVHLQAEMRWCDVVHLHTLPYPHNAFGLRAAGRVGRPVMLTPHFHPGHEQYERGHQYGWMRRSHQVVVVSELEKEELVERGVAAARITVTGCGTEMTSASSGERRQAAVALRRRLGLSETTAIVCCVARKTREKGIGALAAAVSLLRRQGRDVALVLVGPDLPWFRTWWQKQSADMQSFIYDLGRVPADVKRLVLAGSNVFAMPSRHEAFGIVFLEAWAAGLPVIGGADGAQPSVIGEGGVTVPFADPEATAEAVAGFLDEPDKAAAAVTAGRQAIADRYNWETIGRQVTQVARNLVPQHLRVVTASSFYPPHIMGGAELACAGQVEGLVARGCSQHVFAGALDEQRPRHELTREKGAVPVHRLQLHHQDISADKAAHINAPAAAAFGALLEEVGPEIVHLHNLAGLGCDLIHQAADRNLPVVMTLHDFWGVCHRNTLTLPDGRLCSGPGLACAGCLPLMEAVGKPGDAALVPTWERNADLAAALQRVELFLSPSRYLADRFIDAGIPAERIQILPYGMDLEGFAGSGAVPADGPLLFMGYLGWHKGLQIVLRALSHPAASEIELVVAGEGDGQSRFEAMVEELGLSSRVSFLGRVPRQEIPALIARCRALVVPSVWPENAPLTITEAMAAGRPVIGSDLGGIPELVQHEQTGLRVPAGDDGAMAESLARIFGDHAFACTLGESGRQAAGRFGLGPVLDELEGLYRGLLDRPRQPWCDRLPVVALAAAAERWQDPAVVRITSLAESTAGRFHLVPWRRTQAGGMDERRHLQPGMLLLTSPADMDAAAEAVSLQIPFMALCAGDEPLAALARDCGLGWSSPEPEAVARMLSRWLATGAAMPVSPADRALFVKRLVGEA